MAIFADFAYKTAELWGSGNILQANGTYKQTPTLKSTFKCEFLPTSGKELPNAGSTDIKSSHYVLTFDDIYPKNGDIIKITERGTTNTYVINSIDEVVSQWSDMNYVCCYVSEYQP